MVENIYESIGKLRARGGRRSSGPAGLVEPLAIAEARSGDAHVAVDAALAHGDGCTARSEEHTSELQSLMRISYAVFCLKKKTKKELKTEHNAQKIDGHIHIKKA